MCIFRVCTCDTNSTILTQFVQYPSIPLSKIINKQNKLMKHMNNAEMNHAFIRIVVLTIM